MTEQNAENDPFHDLGDGILAEIDVLNKSASRLTIATIVSLFVPAGFLFVFGFAIYRLIQTKQIIKKYPVLGKPFQHYSGKSKVEIKALSNDNLKLKKVLEFNETRKGFVAFLILPLAVFGFIIWLVMFSG